MHFRKTAAAALGALLAVSALGTLPAGAAVLGDVTNDSKTNASDAANILIEAARIGSSGKGSFTSAQKTAADVNSDGKINASDAAKVLIYSASVGSGAFSGTLASYMSSSEVWNWNSGACKLTFPPEWKDKYVISGNTVYCKACYDASKGTGELFSLVSYSADQMNVSIPHRYLLGTTGSGYVNAILPSGVVYDLTNTTQDNAYRSMYAYVQNVLNSAVCSASPNFSTMDLSGDYDIDMSYSSSPVVGCWMQFPESGGQFDPLVVFNITQRKFLYSYELNEGKLGTYLVSIGGPGAALVFLDNDVYQVDIWGGAPHTMTFTNLTRPSRSYQGLAGKTFSYWNDYQDLSYTDF